MYKENIMAFLSTESHKNSGYCDDCLSHQLNIRPRQTVNQVCRTLEQEGRIFRDTAKAECAMCGKAKILNYWKSDGPENNTQISSERKRKDTRLKGSGEWDYSDEWFEETNVSYKIRDHLISDGYEITQFIEDKRQPGYDIVARKNGEITIIEVKGFPSDKYVRGKKKGQKKPTHPNLQAKHWLSDALFSVLCAKSEDWKTHIALGLPKFDRYETLLRQLKPVLERLDITCFLVDGTGEVYVI